MGEWREGLGIVQLPGKSAGELGQASVKWWWMMFIGFVAMMVGILLSNIQITWVMVVAALMAVPSALMLLVAITIFSVITVRGSKRNLVERRHGYATIASIGGAFSSVGIARMGLDKVHFVDYKTGWVLVLPDEKKLTASQLKERLEAARSATAQSIAVTWYEPVPLPAKTKK